MNFSQEEIARPTIENEGIASAPDQATKEVEVSQQPRHVMS
jgi:hypothetical protein